MAMVVRKRGARGEPSWYLVSSVCQGMDNVAHVPIFIFEFFEKLDPHVWDGHCQAIVETNASHFDRLTKQRHARHVYKADRQVRYTGKREERGEKREERERGEKRERRR